MKRVSLDKNYNLVTDKFDYETDFVESIELIKQAKDKGIIEAKEASFLMKLVTKREIKNVAKNALHTDTNPLEIRSLFMNLKSNRIKHV